MKISKNTGVRFEEIVVNILKENKLEINNSESNVDLGIDLSGSKYNSEWIVQIKYYRSERVKPSLIETAAHHMNFYDSGFVTARRMLVVSSRVSPATRRAIETATAVTIVDRDDLMIWAIASLDLLNELNAVLEFGEIRDDDNLGRTFDEVISESSLKPTVVPSKNHNTDLCEKLKNLPRGKGNWREFEELCTLILKHIFDGDLTGWVEQSRTDDELHRFDCICRVRPTSDFWSFILDGLSTRYVVFEFKNYTDKLKQSPVITTEKYLYERAFRRVAIVISRTEVTTGAEKIAQGAMRESGKLILFIYDDDLCKMIKMKDSGEDPSDHLFDITDKFMMSLPR